MAPINLEHWVHQQFQEVGFRDGEFIGKSALKRRLVSHYPKQKQEIRQLVNRQALHSFFLIERSNSFFCKTEFRYQRWPKYTSYHHQIYQGRLPNQKRHLRRACQIYKHLIQQLLGAKTHRILFSKRVIQIGSKMYECSFQLVLSSLIKFLQSQAGVSLGTPTDFQAQPSRLMNIKSKLRTQQPAVWAAENIGETSIPLEVITQRLSNSKISGRTIHKVVFYLLIYLRAKGVCSKGDEFG
jgi:hypothetical protein